MRQKETEGDRRRDNEREGEKRDKERPGKRMRENERE